MTVFKNELSTFNREMQNLEFKNAFEKGYKEFLLSELVIELMEENHKTVRGLAKEVGLSPTIIQGICSGQRKDVKMTNLLGIAEACGYHLFLEKEGHRINLS